MKQPVDWRRAVGKPLTKAQRAILDREIAQLQAEFAKHPKELQDRVNREIGKELRAKGLL
jgi:hypothetical protein